MTWKLNGLWKPTSVRQTYEWIQHDNGKLTLRVWEHRGNNSEVTAASTASGWSAREMWNKLVAKGFTPDANNPGNPPFLS